MKEKFLTIDNFRIKCIEYYGYNDHYYVTLMNDTNGQGAYIEQLVDCRLDDHNLQDRVTECVNRRLK